MTPPLDKASWPAFGPGDAPLDTLASNVSPSTDGEQASQKNNRHALPVPKAQSAKDEYGWEAGPREITVKEIDDALIGREVSRDTFLDGLSRERQLKEQTEDIVRRLARVGIEGRTFGRDTAIVGLVSGKALPIQPFRNCNMLPAVQSKNVHDMLKGIRYLFDVTKKGRLRMLVVSGGWVPLDRYREHHRAHTRRMSKFNSHPTLKTLGIELQFYNVENTIQRDDDGRAMMNLHSHVLFKCRRKLGSKRWNEFLEFARNYFPKGYVHDSKIEKAAEVVKYVFKPQEFEALTDEELGELFLQVAGGRVKFDPETGEVEMRAGEDGELIPVRERGLKFFHPLGQLRAFRKKLRENGQKLIFVPTVDDRWIWRVTEKKTPQERPEPSGEQPPENRVLAITRPMPKFGQRMEPCLIVQDYNGDFEDLILRNHLHERFADAGAVYRRRVQSDLAASAARGEAAPMEHTTTTTVREDGWNIDPRPPPDHRSERSFGPPDFMQMNAVPGDVPGKPENVPGSGPGPSPECPGETPHTLIADGIAVNGWG